LLNTYEALVVRSLHDIDQALNLVTNWQRRTGSNRTLTELGRLGLLPPDVIFTVSITDREGVVTESTGAEVGRNVATEPSFRAQQAQATPFVEQLSEGPTGARQVAFSRRLAA